MSQRVRDSLSLRFTLHLIRILMTFWMFCPPVHTVRSHCPTPHIIIAGDFNAKHAVWGQEVSDARGSQLIDFTSQHGLAVLNDPLSPPTYETAYVSSWIDVTLATPALLSDGYSWEVSEDDSLSEHRYIQVSIGSDTRSRDKRLTPVGLHDLNASLVRDPWFRLVQGAVLRSPTALDLVLSKFHQIYGRAYKRNLRPDKSSDRSKPWWTPQLAAERKRVLAMRRRFQRCRDELLRQQFRSGYRAALALFRAHVRAAKEACVREHERACTRRSLFSQPYRSSFQTS